MADVKVPKLLHLRPISKQKEWYKANKMPLPSHLSGGEGKSAAQAKKDVGEINKAKAKEDRLKVIAAAAKKVIKPSSERVRAMRHNADYFGGGLVGGLDRNRDIIGYVRAGGTIKAGRLGEEAEQIDESGEKTADRLERAAADGDHAKAKAIIAKAPTKHLQYLHHYNMGYSGSSEHKYIPHIKKELKNRGKMLSSAESEKMFNEEVEQVDEVSKADLRNSDAYKKAMANIRQNRLNRDYGKKSAGGGMNPSADLNMPSKNQNIKVDHRTGKIVSTYREEVEQVDETNGEYNKYGHIKPGSVDVDPTSADKPPVYKTNKKPAQYKPQKEEADAVKMARGIAFDKRYKGGNMTGALNAIRKVGTKLKYKNLENHPKVKSALKAANEETEMKYIEEKLTADDPASKWISDFVKSDNPKFAGKSKKERIQMALGAKYASMRKEEVEQIDELKASTLGSYMSKASKDEVARKEQGKEVQAKFKEAGMNVGVPYDRKLHSKTASRAAGKAMALKKLTGAAKVAANEAAEGKTPETSTEVELAKKHGDPKKITYGDVIKARIQAAKKKAVNKGE